MLSHELKQVTKSPIMPISGVSGQGVDQLLRALLSNVEDVRQLEKAQKDKDALSSVEKVSEEKWSPV